MWAVALRTVRDPELAADCVQDGFIAAFRRADSFRGEAAVTTWLHRIVVNACLDRLRRRRPTTELFEYDLADRHDHHASTEVRLDIQEALARLPEGQRAALVLVDMHAVPVAEAAVILGVAEGTIKSRCARGRAALAQHLGLTPGCAPGRAGLTGYGSRHGVGDGPGHRPAATSGPTEQWLNPGEPDGHRGPSNPRRPAHPCLPVRPLHALPEGPHRWTSPRTPLSPTDPRPSPTDRDPTAPAATAPSVTRSRTRAPSPTSTRDLDARVRDLLADAPDPGPMPDDVSERISAGPAGRRPTARRPRPARAGSRAGGPAARTVRPTRPTVGRHGARDAVARRTAQADLPRRRSRCGRGRRRRGRLGPARDEATERRGGHRRHLRLGRHRA